MMFLVTILLATSIFSLNIALGILHVVHAGPGFAVCPFSELLHNNSAIVGEEGHRRIPFALGQSCLPKFRVFARLSRCTEKSPGYLLTSSLKKRLS